jgi:hypothetical protein
MSAFNVLNILWSKCNNLVCFHKNTKETIKNCKNTPTGTRTRMFALGERRLLL